MGYGAVMNNEMIDQTIRGLRLLEGEVTDLEESVTAEFNSITSEDELDVLAASVFFRIHGADLSGR